jgi:hypothetical protein
VIYREIFLSIEGEMFCLKPPKDGSISYYNLNRGSVTDTEMDEMLGITVIFSLLINRLVGVGLIVYDVGTVVKNKKNTFLQSI